MSKPILDPDFWAFRLTEAKLKRDVRQAVYVSAPDLWARIEARHRSLLFNLIGRDHSVLDAACGYGRLLELLPADWHGTYLGFDLSPDMIKEAHARYPGRAFAVGDLKDPPAGGRFFDWCVLISVKRMLVENLGAAYWDECKAALERVASRVLVLEYDPDDNGELV